MESIKIYEDSLKEITKIRRQLAYSSITLNLDALDGKTKESVIYALSKTLAERENAVKAVLTGAK